MVATKEQRNKRVKKTAEVFTPPALVNQMLDKLPASVWEEGKTFCDPACGNGNMLIHVLYRKIAVYDHDPLEALQSLYGADIMRDNIRETRLRLLKMVNALCGELDENDIAAVLRNMAWVNLKKYPNGSLDYDFSFRGKPKPKDIERWVGWVDEGKLNEVTLPVSEEPESGPNKDLFPEPTLATDGYDIPK